MKIERTNLDNVLLIKPDIFEDFRGQYVETYNERLYKENGITVDFIQDDISTSTKNVLRGIHGDSKTTKLVQCLYGRFYLVVVNCITGDENYGKWQSFILSDSNRYQVLIPPNHGNSFLTLSDLSIFHYKQTTYYDRDSQFTYKWNDPLFNIWWPIKNPIVTQRDEGE